jgi:hypothetical protein
MPATIGQRYSYDGPAGRCSVIVINGGRILETRRDGKTFIRSDDPTEEHFSNTTQLRWPSEEAWRATLPAGTVTRPPRAPTQEEVVERVRALWTSDPDTPHPQAYAQTLRDELGVSDREVGAALRTVVFETLFAPALPPPMATPKPKASDAEVAARATALFRAHPYVAHRGIDAQKLHEEFGIPRNEAEAALRRAQEQFRVPAPPPSAAAGPEAFFYERTIITKATLLIKKPSAKDEAWESRDRAAYDTADPAPRWGLPEGGLYLWLAVQHGYEFVPVCRDIDSRTLRFYIDGALRTFAEAGISPTAPLWARVSEENPALRRVS